MLDETLNTATEPEVETEFERLLKVYANRLHSDEVIRNMASIKRQAREQALGRRLLLDEARRLNLRVPDAEVADAADGMKKGLGGEEAFTAHLAGKGLTPETFQENVRNALLVEKLVRIVTANAAPATEKEAASYFMENRAEFAESAEFDQVKDLIMLAMTNARKNELLVRHIEELKRNSGAGGMEIRRDESL